MVSRKQLKAMGLEDANIDIVLNAHSADIGEIRSQLTTAQQELATSREQLTARDTQLEQLKAAGGDADALKQQITQLQADNKAKDDQHKQDMHKLRVDTAVSQALATANARNPATIAPLLTEFLAKAELDETSGEIKGLVDKLSELAGDEATSFLFATTDGQQQTTFHGATPGNTNKQPPSQQKSELETRLADAKKSNNLAQVMQVRREAAEQGIQLN